MYDSKIPFNRPNLDGNEQQYLKEVLAAARLSGKGQFTQQCLQFFRDHYGFVHGFLTGSCTAALEMAALLLRVEPGDEVILPTYTYVSTANAFALRGAKLVFADSLPDHPNLDTNAVAQLITSETKVVVLVHYGGVACDLAPLLQLRDQHAFRIVEDAAHAIDARYRQEPLGGIGDLAAFSFHETKNIACGEGGLLVVNDPELSERAALIWEEGTNKAAFEQGKVPKYEWMDLGSSYLPSELNAAVLWAQLERLESIQATRHQIWSRYQEGLASLSGLGVLQLACPDFANHNAHLYGLVCRSEAERDQLVAWLAVAGIHAHPHFLALHRSPFFQHQHDGRSLPHADRFEGCLLRLPLFSGLSVEDQNRVIDRVLAFFQQ